MLYSPLSFISDDLGRSYRIELNCCDFNFTNHDNFLQLEVVKRGKTRLKLRSGFVPLLIIIHCSADKLGLRADFLT